MPYIDEIRCQGGGRAAPYRAPINQLRAGIRLLQQKICGTIPSGRVVGVSGGAGGLGATVGGGELVLNYNSGQISAFGFGGFQAGWNGVLSASAYTGVAWGLNSSNSNYAGGFTGFNVGTPAGGGFVATSSGGVTNGVGGLSPSTGSGSVTVAGGSIGLALLGKFQGGLSGTNYTQPLQLGKFWAFSIADWGNYIARRVCQ